MSDDAEENISNEELIRRLREGSSPAVVYDDTTSIQDVDDVPVPAQAAPPPLPADPAAPPVPSFDDVPDIQVRPSAQAASKPVEKSVDSLEEVPNLPGSDDDASDLEFAVSAPIAASQTVLKTEEFKKPESIEDYLQSLKQNAEEEVAEVLDNNEEEVESAYTEAEVPQEDFAPAALGNVSVEQDDPSTPVHLPPLTDMKEHRPFDSTQGKHNEGMELAPIAPHPLVMPETDREIVLAEKRSKEPVSLSLISLVLAAVFILLLLWGGSQLYRYLGWYEVSPHTIHWHAEVIIEVQGTPIIIPPSVGIIDQVDHPGPIHTHEADNIVHMHNEGRVQAKDVMLREFFKVWGETFNEDQILGYRDNVDGRLIMLVNGEVNREFERYVMQDGDKIEIILE